MLRKREASADDHADYRAEDRPRREIREPMDRHRDADANVKCVGDRHTPKPSLFWKEGEDGAGHRKCNRRVRGRPAPENSAPQKAEFEDAGQIRPDIARRMSAAGKCLVSSGNESSDDLGLTDRPTDQTDLGASAKVAERNQQQRQNNGQDPANDHRREHAGLNERTARAKEVLPVKTGQNENHGQQDSCEMPQDSPGLKAGD